MKTTFIIIVVFLNYSLPAQGTFAPNASTSGTTALHKDSSVFSNWATNCTVNRGWQNVTDTSLGKTDVGFPANATDKSGINGTISLGDGGEAILTFEYPVFNGTGYDFAVFENGFSDDFLELAFVEVSSDGANFFRFDAVSQTQTDTQTGGFGDLNATNLYNLAGKYRAQFGTPFDLEELSGIPELDINNITHVKIIDVVGSIDSAYASYDLLGSAINDPFPTPFGSGGFDLDAVGVIHQFVGIETFETTVKMYPNPCKEKLTLHFEDFGDKLVQVSDLHGRIIDNIRSSSNQMELNTTEYPKGIYFVKVVINGRVSIEKLIIN